mmetsp:Transcript_29611/g.68460  ORF Transcript_29611/g.68460 Transcript_29611/m.68460 type:complete len:140 (+) Transcript_29611:163-582(+)
MMWLDRHLRFLLVLVVVFCEMPKSVVESFAFPKSPTTMTMTTTMTTSTSTLTRSEFFQATFGVAASVFLAAAPAIAKEDPTGTKRDPAFQGCVSNCLYQCTLPKGELTRSRQECLPECKQKCAKNKEQLLLGEPKSSSS